MLFMVCYLTAPLRSNRYPESFCHFKHSSALNGILFHSNHRKSYSSQIIVPCKLQINSCSVDFHILKVAFNIYTVQFFSCLYCEILQCKWHCLLSLPPWCKPVKTTVVPVATIKFNFVLPRNDFSSRYRSLSSDSRVPNSYLWQQLPMSFDRN